MQFGVGIFHANSISISEKESKPAWCLRVSQVIHVHKKVMTEEKKSVVHSVDGNVKQSDSVFWTNAVCGLIIQRETSQGEDG